MADEQPAVEMTEEQETQPEDTGAGEDVTALREEIERMRAALKNANAEAKQHRLKAKELTEAQDEAQRAADEEQGKFRELYEAEQKRAADAVAAAEALRSDMRNQKITSALKDEAVALGFADPADVAHFIQLDTVGMDDDGNPQGIKDLVQELATSKPHLISRPERAPNINAQSGVGNAPRPGQMSDDEVKEMAARLGLSESSIRTAIGA